MKTLLFAWGCIVDDVEEQIVWNCNEAPLPLPGRGRRRERPDDFILLMMGKQAHTDPPQEKAISAQSQKLKTFLFAWACIVDDVEEQIVWNCNEAPLPLLGRGRRRERPDDFIPWKRGVSL